MIEPFPWQEPCVSANLASLAKHGVFANGSEMGTGKTIVTCVAGKRRGRALFVACPKSVIADWYHWGEQVGVPVTAVNYEKLRAGRTPHGKWLVKGKAFQWTLPENTDLVFDEAHKLGGMDTQQSALLIAAKRQRIPHYLLSGTLMESPLKGKAIGFSLGLHSLLNFWAWAKARGVSQGHFGMEWKPKNPTALMEEIRGEMGDKFFRIRKAEVPGFPEKQVIPFFVSTEDMPDEEALDGGKYGYHARMVVELLKVPGLADKARDLIENDGHSVIIFVNYLDTLNALIERFPHASLIRGGQTSFERADSIKRFQNNATDVALVMIQAGGTGVSFHDLYGTPRTSIICPGNSASEFLQAIDRIHRAGAKSAATVFVAFASGVPVERRMRDRMEGKMNNLAALNDSDFANSSVTVNHTHATNQLTPLPSGALPGDSEGAQLPVSSLPDQCAVAESGRPHDPAGSPTHHLGNSGGSGGLGQGGTPGGSSPHGAHATPGAGPQGPVCGNAHADGGLGGSSVGSPNGIGGGEHDRAANGRPDQTRQDVLNPQSGGGAEQMVKLLPTPDATPPAPAADATGNHVVRKHARSSPSKLKNLEICPSYEGDNDGPVHPVTLRGTAMHEALETGNDSGLLDEKDNEELRLVTMCRDFQDAEYVPGEIVITEPHLKTHDPDVQGFADRVVLEPAVYVLDMPGAKPARRARIRDYKMGWNVVDTPDINPQAIAYTVAVFLQYTDVTEVDFAFLIPRLDAVLQHTFKREELPALKLRLSVIAERVRKLAGKEFNVNNDNCLYCGRKATCTALHGKVLAIARGFDEGEKLPLPAVFNPTQVVDMQQIAYGLNMARIAAEWAEAWNKYALKLRLELGVEIPGYDIIERSAKREVADVVGAYKLVKGEFGVTEEEFLAACKISITKLEDAVKEHAGHGEKAKAAEVFTDRMMDEGLLTRGASFHVLQKSKKKAVKTALPVAA